MHKGAEGYCDIERWHNGVQATALNRSLSMALLPPTACSQTTAAATSSKKNIPTAAAVEKEAGGSEGGVTPAWRAGPGHGSHRAVAPAFLSLQTCRPAKLISEQLRYVGKVGSTPGLPLLLVFPCLPFFLPPSPAPSSLSAAASHFGVTFSKHRARRKAALAPRPSAGLEAQHRHSSIKPG